jgi:DNA-directed RNA polymerase specialized sigma24 family protein
MCVNWEPGSPFLDLIRRLIAVAARRWQGREPCEALSQVWKGLTGRYPEGLIIDPDDKLLRTIVCRRVSRCFTRSRGMTPARGKWISFKPGIHDAYLESRSPTPDGDLSDREQLDWCMAQLAGLPARRREAVLCKMGLGPVGTVGELARIWGTSPQNVHQQARKGLEQLRATGGGWI